MTLPEPVFPPLFTGHPVELPRPPFDVAVAGAAAGTLGAADLVWVRDASRLDCALVLEPDVDRRRAAGMVFVAMVAFGDSFGAIAPPEVPFTWRWPATICVNGARVGRARAAMAAEDGADGCPLWMTVGLTVDIRRDRPPGEPGETPDETDLAEEGCGELTATEMLESYSRHLLNWIHTWQTEGFRPVHDLMLLRAEGFRDNVRVRHRGRPREGRFLGLDDHGNLLIEENGSARVLDMLDEIDMVPSAGALA